MGRLLPASAESSSTTASSPHLYPEALQLKLYQAFIFSIPILFSIILVLLFYLFYLKRRENHASNQAQQNGRITTRNSSATQQQTTNHNYLDFPCQLSLKVELKDKLPIVLFDEELRTRDSLCCVCLGEFEMEEELLQVPSCKHVFHGDCIHHWLHSNSTCPLCRCSVVSATVSRMHTRQSSDHQPPQPTTQQTLTTHTPENSTHDDR